MKRNYLLLCLLALCPFAVFAQVAPLVQVEVPPPATICDPTGTTALTANFNVPQQTTSYTPYPEDTVFNPSFPTTGGTLLDATQDDVWSPVVTLPFSFAFYGNFYNQLIVGSNGLISFDISDANGYCPWAFTASVPSPAIPTNAIFGIYQDTNIAMPPVTNPAVQNVNYYVLDTGVNQAPNRVFVVNFNSLPQFSCNNGVGLQTSQIVLHEGSNIVDFFVFDRTCCPGWNSGSGVIGMQNASGTVGHLAGADPANNTGCWSMFDTHYQIAPSAAQVPHTLQWYEGGTPVNNGIPTGGTPIFAVNDNPINVGPGTYTAVVTYTNPDGTTYTVSDTQTVSVLQLDVADPLDIALCDPTQTPPYTVNINQNNYIAAGSPTDPDPTHYAFSYYETEIGAINGSPANDINTPNAFITSGPFPKSIWVRIEELVSTGCVNVREFFITEGPSGTIAYPGDPTGLTTPMPGQYCSNLTGQHPVTETALTSGGTYSASPAGLTIDPTTGAITPTTSTVGVYTVTYTIAANPPCPAFTTTATVEIVACACTVTVSTPEDQTLCVGDAVTAINYTTAGATSASVSGNFPPGLAWAFDPATESVDVTGTATTAGVYTYTVQLNVTASDFCSETTTITVTASSNVTLNAGSNDNQTICVDSLIADIYYTIDATATGVAVNNLPAGVTYTVVGNLLTISGTPTAVPASPTYDITFTGCNAAPVLGNINVLAAPTVALVSGDDAQTPCVNAAITNIVYSFGGSATGLNVSGLPPGVTFAAGPGANEITISGTPNTAGNYSYQVETISTCPTNPVLIGTINVDALPTITGDTALCLGGMTTLTGSGTASTTTPWTSSNPAIASIDATGLVTGNAAGGPVTITYMNSNGCTTTSTITVDPLPTIGGTFTLCEAATSTLTGSGTPAATGAWVSDDTSVATVDATGTVTGIAGGTANITYTDANGCTATQAITVIAAPTIGGTFNVCVGLTTALTASAAPSTGTPWASSNTAVATVSSTGVVAGVSAGTTVITFTDANGCQAQETVTVNALPTITGATALCEGTTTTLTGSGTASATAPWVSSDPSIASVDATGLVTGIAAGGPVTITYTNADGCTITSTITVNPLPTIGGTFTLCEGDTSILTGSGTPAATGAWVSDAPAVATVNATGTVAGIAGGTANITYTDANGCTSTQTVTIIALPTITGDTALCLGGMTTLTGSGTASTTTPWTSSNPAIASIDATGLVTGNAAGGPVTITYMNSNGCTTTSTITVDPLPTIGGTFTLCEAATSTLTGSGTPAATGAWVSDDTSVATVDATGTVTGIAGGTANITYTDANGCTATQAITVIAAPTIGGTFNVCVGLTTALTASAAPSTGTPWASSNTTVATVNSAGVVAGVSAGTTVITFTDANGCQAQETVTVNALPTITGATALCEGTTTTLTGSGTASATAPWVSSDPSIASVDATGLVTGIAAGGPVTITYTNADGCTITSTITVNPLPTIGGTFTLCEGDTSILTGSGTPAATGAWVSDAPAVATVNATGTVAGIAGGTANITYTDANGCTSTQTVTIIALPTITGDTALCLGATTTLTGSGTASTTTPWTSSNPSIASIDATGLVTGNAAGGPVTITYMNSNGCTTTSTITVDPLPTIGGTFTLCEAATSALTGSGTPAATNAWVSDDTSVATVDATGTVTGIAGGTANITYTDANGCTATQAITVIAAPTIGGTFNVCVGLTTALTASAAPSTGTPWASSNTTVATVSSTGVVAGVSAGTTVITFTDANGCQAQETVTVIALPTVTGATALPDVCIGTAMTSAVYTFGGSATGMTIDPAFTLPAGISLAPGAPNTYVLSGTPTMDGLYTFDIITTGGCTPADRITVTMTVKPDATLSAAPAGADDQTVCINVVINPIVFTVGNGATGAVVSAGLLPAGVTLTNSGGGTFTLSGSPTQAGIFNYTVTTTTVNGCTEASIPGRIEVLSPGTLVLTSAAGTTNQPACQDVNILPITYMPGNGATTVSVSGLPAGITGVMNTSTGAFEISGASNVIGAHPYTVSNTDGCLPFATLSGVITITPKASIVLTSAAWTDDQTLCMVQETLTDIVFTVADGATGASIVDGTVPVGISGSYDPLNHTFTIGGTPTESGTFSFKVRTTGGCGFSELEATITVDPLPTIVLPTDGFVCIDRNGNPVPGSTTTLTTGLPQANHTFEWSDANGIIAGATANSYEATAPGVYAVKVTNTVTGCSNSETTTVNSSLPPMSVTATASEYFTQDQMVTVVALPAGNYEYQMDNGAWQDTGNFYNLPSGEHHFKVRDKVGCGELETSIIIIDYPRFFTPNNDGYNDTWNIEDLNLLGNQETSKIEIYDRYGKLIKQISPLGIGWDGTFNGKMLPATDYWFRVYYTDEVGIRKEFKAHFSLKR